MGAAVEEELVENCWETQHKLFPNPVGRTATTSPLATQFPTTANCSFLS